MLVITRGYIDSDPILDSGFYMAPPSYKWVSSRMWRPTVNRLLGWRVACQVPTIGNYLGEMAKFFRSECPARIIPSEDILFTRVCVTYNRLPEILSMLNAFLLGLSLNGLTCLTIPKWRCRNISTTTPALDDTWWTYHRVDITVTITIPVEFMKTVGDFGDQHFARKTSQSLLSLSFYIYKYYIYICVCLCVYWHNYKASPKVLPNLFGLWLLVLGLGCFPPESSGRYDILYAKKMACA